MSRSILAGAAALAFVTLAACSDAPTAPSAKPSPAASEPSLGSGISVGGGGVIVRQAPVSVTLEIWDQDGSQGVPGTTVEFSTSTGAKQTVVDNSAADADARVGYYRVSMPATGVWYKAKVVGMDDDFSFDGAEKTVSAFVSPTLVSMGHITLMRKPGIYVFLHYNGGFALGQTIKITGPNGFSRTITDGSAADKSFDGTQNPNDGKFQIQVPVTGTYYVCTLTSPQAYWDADCVNVWALQYFIAYSADLKYEQKWVIPKF